VVKNELRVNKRFYLNGNLHRALHISRARDLITAYDYMEEKTKVYSLSDVRRNMQNAFTVTQAAELVDRHRDRIKEYMEEGHIEVPQREHAIEHGAPGRYFFSEDDMMELRDFMATVHIGRPRKDGRVTNNRVPSREELRAIMQSGKMLYVKENEEFVPVWKAKEF